MRTRTDNSFMPRIGIAQIAIESKTCPSDSKGLTVRQWLNTKSFEEQYEYGIKMLKEFGWE